MITLTQQEETILATVQPVADELGIEVVRLRVQGGKRPGLQIMIEKAGGAPTGVEDCARLSRALSPVFELNDPLPEAYKLEVSTPGIDRPLTRIGDFARWTGHKAKIELSIPVEGQRRFNGVITGEDEDGVHLELNDETELVAHVHEMSKASLILTDELIDATRAAGQLPPQPDEDDLGEFEIDEEQDETEMSDEISGKKMGESR